MIRPSSWLGVLMMIMSFALVCIDFSSTPLILLMLLRVARSPLPVQRVLLMIVHQLHLYIHLLFSVTGHQPTTIVHLLFLWGSHLGRLAGRLPLLHHCTNISTSFYLYSDMSSRCSSTILWIHSFTYIVWTFGSSIMLRLPKNIITALFFCFRLVLGILLHPFTIPIRVEDRQLTRIFTPRRLRLWVNIIIGYHVLHRQTDPLSFVSYLLLLLSIGYWLSDSWHSWQLKLEATSYFPDDLVRRLVYRLRLNRRLRRREHLMRASRWTYLIPLLLLLTFLIQPTSAWSSHKEARMDIATEFLPPLFSIVTICGQVLYSSAVSVNDKSLNRLKEKEKQHKADPYRPQRSSLFDDPSLGAGEAAAPKNISKDIIPGHLYGNHSHCTDQHVTQLKDILDKRESVFYRKGGHLPTYHGGHLPFTIPFDDETTPQYQSPRNFSCKEAELIKAENDKMLELDITEPAPITCPHASNPILAAKKDPHTGEYTEIRFCIDFRHINRRTRRFTYRTLTPDQLFQRIGKAGFITTLDLKSGYHLIPIPEHERNKTAFWVGNRLYRYKRMPFGLAGSPAYFQETMDHTFHDLLDANGKPYTAIYLDDICIYSNTYEEHLQHVDAVLARLIERFGDGCVHPDKSVFVSESVEYLGYQLSTGGILTPQAAKIKAFSDLPEPDSLTALRSALSLFSYYRSFCPLFSQIAAPLNDLLKADAIPPGRNGFSRAWTAEHSKAFQSLKSSLCKPGLAIRTADSGRPFFLHTDWSVRGCGAILTQYDDDDREYIVAAISRTLLPAEQRYSPFEGEALCVVWATTTFRPYIYGQKLTIVTDHRPLKHLWRNAELSNKFARWVALLQDLDFEIIHRPGTQQPADHLSRYPLDHHSDSSEHYLRTDDSFQANSIRADMEQSLYHYGFSPAHYLAMSSSSVSHYNSEADDLMRLGMTDLELRRHRLTPFLPSDRPQHRVFQTTASLLNNTPLPLSFTHKTWIVIDLCGGIASGLATVLEQCMIVSQYIYVDSDTEAQTCAQERVRHLVETKPHLFRRNATRLAFSTWPMDIHDITSEHLQSLNPSPDEGILIISGTPCQDFSTAGSQRGTSGQRGNLTKLVARIISTLQSLHPQVFYLIENVHPAIKGDSSGTALLSHLTESLGQPVICDAARFDSFAHRVRLYWTNLCPTSDLQSTLDQIRRNPHRYVNHILPSHLLPQKPRQTLSAPFYCCESPNTSLQALPTIMATPASYAFRDQGPGMLFNLNTSEFEEPSADIREVAMGYNKGVTAGPGRNETKRWQLIGNAFDMNAVNYILTAAFMLNSNVPITADSSSLILNPANSFPQLTPLSNSQLKTIYSAFALREMSLWGWSPGLYVGIANPGLTWPLRVSINEESSTTTPSPSTNTRPGIGYTDGLISGGGNKGEENSPIFVPATDQGEVVATVSFSEPTIPPVMLFDLHDAAEEFDVLRLPPMACVIYSSAAAATIHPVREPAVLPEFSHSGVDPWEDINMLRYLKKEFITDISNDPSERRRIVLRASAYELNGDVLLRRMRNGTTRTVPPIADREKLIQQTHEGAVHLGEKRVVYLLQVNHYWPGMWRQVHDILTKCDVCRRVGSTLQGAGDTLHPLKVVSLFYRWSLDYCKLPKSKLGYCRVLIAVENLTRFVVLIPLFDKEAITTAFAFRTHIYGMFGSSAEVITDGGSEFLAEFDELMESLLIDHRHSSSYHPQANGMAERIVQIVKKSLKRSVQNPNVLHQWETIIPSLQLAYNSSKQTSTKIAPYTALFAQVPVVPPESKARFDEPIDLCSETNNEHDQLLVTELIRRMILVHQAGVMCTHNLDIAQHRDTERYKLVHSGNWKPSHSPLQLKDFVILKKKEKDSFDIPRRKQIYQTTGFGDQDSVELRGRDNKRMRTNLANLAKYPADNVDPTIVPPKELPCEICSSPHYDKLMLLCDQCNRGFHTYCLGLQFFPREDWFCPECSGLPAPAKKRPRGRGRPPACPPEPALQ